MTSTIPTGFQPHGRRSPVTDAWEPIYSKELNGVILLGTLLAQRHCNSRGFVHGGVLASLADNAMGLSYVAEVRGRRPGYTGSAVTLSLTIDYVATAQIGAWLEIAPRVIKAGNSIGFVDALVTANETMVARASASFKLIG